MVVLRILEASLYLFFSVIADYIQVDLVSFLEILGSVLVVVDLIKNLTGNYFESATQVQERKVIAQRDDDKFQRIEVPVVHSLMVFKMCEGARSSSSTCS
ncbi:hypothetical protein TNIN_216011 [Trichonephila inaurata madagascariensis]|uniref:Uncharacterized protein n=1 Tax=Trichonephila inaurata madagascariensis TaxID=2747483 RepID=A0A8X7CHL3_9ARAC|nr:hypothetical protein TNIN_216011 [Trichonephila inaurata madagascariensis]